MAQTKVNRRFAQVFSTLHRLTLKVTGGRVGGSLGGGDIIILGTTGRKSGKRRTVPLLAGNHDDGWIIIASFSGHDFHPDWFHNLKANPSVSVEVGGQTHSATARITSGEEREACWKAMADVYDDYNEYASVTDREIPVVVLERV